LRSVEPGLQFLDFASSAVHALFVQRAWYNPRLSGAGGVGGRFFPGNDFGLLPAREDRRDAGVPRSGTTEAWIGLARQFCFCKISFSASPDITFTPGRRSRFVPAGSGFGAFKIQRLSGLFHPDFRDGSPRFSGKDHVRASGRLGPSRFHRFSVAVLPAPGEAFRLDLIGRLSVA
jgi:hypothetical protein